MLIKGHTVYKVLVNPAVEIEQELYLGITNDRSLGRPVLMVSGKGGMDVEEIDDEDPKAILREPIDLFLGLHNYQITRMASTMNLPRQYWKLFKRIVRGLYNCFIQTDALLAEINPLAITRQGNLIALDSKLIIDDNALYRHPAIANLRDTEGEPEAETRARAAGISYVKLNGSIGCMVNGAGLAMTTMDIIHTYGGIANGPANFLDIGGGAKAEKVKTALEIILEDPSVSAVLLNIFGGITRCDEVARGVTECYSATGSTTPLIARLEGTKAASGLRLLTESRIPYLKTASTLTGAAQQAVAATRKHGNGHSD
jgi:succinyl-CoA synthetase beta subunit